MFISQQTIFSTNALISL